MSIYPITMMVLLGGTLASSMIIQSLGFNRSAIGIAFLGFLMSLFVILPRIGTLFPVSFLYHYEGNVVDQSGHLVIWNFFRIPHFNGDAWLFHTTIMALMCFGGHVWICFRANTCRQAKKLAA